MTPPPGNVRPDGRGGLRVVIEGIEHLVTAPDVAYLNGPPRYSRGTPADGHDACLGEIPGAAAACCGHGVTEDYILYLPPEV